MIAQRLHFTLAAALAAIGIVACHAPLRAQAPGSVPEPSPGAYVVEVTAEDYAFRAPDEIPSGWTTLRFRNEGEETHFLFLTRLPDGRTFDDYVEDVGVPLNELWYAMRSGEIDKAEAGERLGRVLPEWFGSARQMGGPGLVAPGGTAQTTLKLEPGSYVLECYMKTPEGEFHALDGMARPLTVTGEPSGASAPEADIRIMLSNDGIATEGELTPGRHTIAVHFAEHPEAGFGHDVHLVRLSDATDVDQVVPWMDWMNVDGLRNPAPFTFLGGTHEMPVGSTVYLSVDLEPGRYAWIAETTAAQGMVKEFTVR